MRNTIIIVGLMVNIFVICCTPNPSVLAEANKFYQKYKNNFDKKYVDHFPAKMGTSTVHTPVFSSMEQKKNNFSLILYQYNVKIDEIQDVNAKFKKTAIAEYKSSDPCLLVINGFETSETYEYRTVPVVDSTLLNLKCYSNKYPVPNFINYEDYNKDRPLRLDNTFTIYVLESKKMDSDSWKKEFGMKPNKQMPDNWKNGYSKGVAISQEKKTVIYWMVIF